MSKILSTMSMLAAFGLSAMITETQATIVTLQTSAGDIHINLFDQTTPVTVANFLTYVNDGLYDNTIIHRAVPGFILQGGGIDYGTGAEAGFDYIQTDQPIENEPKLSNVRGSVAMAKSAVSPDSATSQFFFNLTDNRGGDASLDTQNGGFSVFGYVDEASMAVIDAIAAYPRYNLNQYTITNALAEIPLITYEVGDVPVMDNFVIIESATVTDAAIDTAAALNPVVNPNNVPVETSPNPSSGGSLGLVFLAGLMVGAWRRRVI